MKFQQQELAHFYLVEPSQLDSSGALNLWIEDFLQQQSEKSIQNHPDILLINSDPEKRVYKWEELSVIFSFLNHRPLEWHQKVIVIPDAHKISDLISNKLLKILEEPPVPCTFFLLNPQKKTLLHTIESRAVKLQLPLEKEEQEIELPDLKNIHLHQFIDFMKKNPMAEGQLVKSLMNRPDIAYEATVRLQEHAQLMQKDNTFYNSPQYRLFKLFATLRNHPSLTER